MRLGLMEEKQQHCVEMSPDFLNPRAGAAHAGTVIVLNYRADRDAASAPTSCRP